MPGLLGVTNLANSTNPIYIDDTDQCGVSSRFPALILNHGIVGDDTEPTGLF
jgi:hypothetical protein